MERRTKDPRFHYPTQYQEGATTLIRFAGLIWLQDPQGNDVDLTQFLDHIPHGVFAPCDGDYGIQTVDELAVFESDFDAAKALADALTKHTGLEYTIWYEAESPFS